MTRVLGRVIEIMRYPVKSMAGERRTETEIDWQGLEGDRQYGFVKRGAATRFPWFTGRDHSELVRYEPMYDDPENPRTSPLSVRTPRGSVRLIGDSALVQELEAAADVELDLIQLGVGAYDLMPLSILTTASLAALAQRHGGPLDHRRFRANILVDSDTIENEWQGRRVRFGDAEDSPELLLAYPAPRCAMVTIDPSTAERDPSILRTIVREFGNAFAMYASVAQPGILRVGDGVTVTTA